MAGAACLLHAFNHTFDALNGSGGWDQTLALFVLAMLTLAALWRGAGSRLGLRADR